MPLPVKLVADADAGRELLKYRVVEAGGVFAFELQRSPLSLFERSLKRSFDIVGALALGLLLSPLLLAVAVLVYLTSEGPVLFRQTRSGFNGRPFTIYKFRTMTVQENGSQIVQARRGDLRANRWRRASALQHSRSCPELIYVSRARCP